MIHFIILLWFVCIIKNLFKWLAGRFRSFYDIMKFLSPFYITDLLNYLTDWTQWLLYDLIYNSNSILILILNASSTFRSHFTRSKTEGIYEMWQYSLTRCVDPNGASFPISDRTNSNILMINSCTMYVYCIVQYHVCVSRVTDKYFHIFYVRACILEIIIHLPYCRSLASI